MNAKVVLRKERAVPSVGKSKARSILSERVRNSKFKISERVLTGRSVETEHCVVVQQRLLDVLVQRKLAAKPKGMASVRVAEDVAHRVEVGSRNGTRDSLSEVKESSDADLR